MLLTFDSKKKPGQPAKHKAAASADVRVMNLGDPQQPKRSTKGCLTCKARKKKCDEIKPVCGDCSRLNKNCVYVDPDNMDTGYIKSLKQMVQKNVSMLKVRKRKNSANHWEGLFGPNSPNSPNIVNLLNPENPVNTPVTPELSLSPPKPVLSQAVVASRQPIAEIDSEEEALDEEFKGQLVKTQSLEFLLFLKENHDIFRELLTSSPTFDINQLFTSYNSPSPKMNPDLLADLPEKARYYYDYYIDVLSTQISVAPKSTSKNENFYQQVFIPLAQQDMGVMYSVLAWACFHIGKDNETNEGLNYVKLALQHFSNNNSNDRSTTINKLASLLLLLGAEICRGDVKNWATYMEWGSKLLHQNGGLTGFQSNKQEFWLISNFAYHDVLSSNKADKGLYLPNAEYDQIFNSDLTNGIFNPLVGIAKEIYSYIGHISSLAFETNKKLASIHSDIEDSPIYEVHDDDEFPDSEASTHGRINDILLSVKQKAEELNTKIDESKPKPNDLLDLNDQEFEWQITMFETFKLSAKLYLRQAILKCNPSTIDSQILNNDLLKCLDIILGTPVEPSLLFPVFMAGIHCVSKTDRTQMMQRIEKFIETYGPWSVIRARDVIQKIWAVNNGDSVVDWHGILREMGWEINFA